MMKFLILLGLAAFISVAKAQCACDTMKWARCESKDNGCTCNLLIGSNVNQLIECNKLIPKCFLMKAEMYRARTGQDTRSIGGKPVETAFVDNDGIYDPDCENNGLFKARQCNGTEECWCVNSAGVRRTEKGDKTLMCEEVVETFMIRLQLTHKEINKKVEENGLKDAIATAMQERYIGFNKSLVKEVQYDPVARLIVVDVEKEKKDRNNDLARMAYYMEKDVKVMPLFKEQNKFSPKVGDVTLEMENILVYYVDEKPPTFVMKHLSKGIIAVIVIVVLLVVGGLVAVFLLERRQRKYRKAQASEMNRMS